MFRFFLWIRAVAHMPKPELCFFLREKTLAMDRSLKRFI